MRKNSQAEVLNARIKELENKQNAQLMDLKAQAKTIYEGLQPLNLIKKLFADGISSPELKHNILNNAIGLATGFVSKKLLLGASLNPFKKILGSILQFTLGNLVARNADAIKSKAEELIKKATKQGIYSNEEYPDEYIY
ncbi:MAG: hypothetical protein IPP51_17485 [Bacteroidetes bacterium]|nr:hypothetical protein [Bacteroidota bacterium]